MEKLAEEKGFTGGAAMMDVTNGDLLVICFISEYNSSLFAEGDIAAIKEISERSQNPSFLIE